MGALRDVGLAVGVRITRLSIRLAGFRRTVSLLGRLPTPMAGRPVDEGGPERWAAAIRRLGGRPYGGTCLDRSVFLWSLMRQRGLAAQMRIGVAFEGSALEGHAWVEYDGRVVNDEPDVAELFAVFDEDPAGIAFS